MPSASVAVHDDIIRLILQLAIKRYSTYQDDDSDDDEDEDEKRKRQLYAGGGKSGLAIEDPTAGGPQPDEDDVVAQILKQAREDTRQAQQGNNPSAGPSRGSAPPSRSGGAFFGGGNTLGSDETPSVAIPDPTSVPAPSGPAGVGGGAGESRAQAMRRALQAMMGGLAPGGAGGAGGEDEEEDDEDGEDEGETAIRHLTFWKDGFSIEDGPLMRYDEPGNKEILEAIKSGRAPLSLLKVKFGQPVEVRVAQRSTEAYRPPPPRPMKAFEGSGNRLGSPAPEVVNTSASASASSTTTYMPGGFGAAAGTIAAATGGSGSSGTAPAPSRAVFQLDASQPTTSIQVRLADGTKIVAKMNLTHTIGDIRGFVRAAQSDTRPFTIQTTFPNKVLEDDSQTIAEAKLQNAVVVQRWS